MAAISTTAVTSVYFRVDKWLFYLIIYLSKYPITQYILVKYILKMKDKMKERFAFLF